MTFWGGLGGAFQGVSIKLDKNPAVIELCLAACVEVIRVIKDFKEYSIANGTM